MKTYVTPDVCKQMRKNTDKLIDILNHSMTEMKVDVCWLKKIQGWEIGVLLAILGTIITIAIKV